MDTDEDDSFPQGGCADGKEGRARCSGSAPPEEMLEPPMTRSHDVVGSSGFTESHFYQYLDDHFSLLGLIASNRTWSIMFIMHISTAVGPSLHLIGGLAASQLLLMHCIPPSRTCCTLYIEVS